MKIYLVRDGYRYEAEVDDDAECVEVGARPIRGGGNAICEIDYGEGWMRRECRRREPLPAKRFRTDEIDWRPVGRVLDWSPNA